MPLSVLIILGHARCAKRGSFGGATAIRGSPKSPAWGRVCQVFFEFSIEDTMEKNRRKESRENTRTVVCLGEIHSEGVGYIYPRCKY